MESESALPEGLPEVQEVPVTVAQGGFMAGCTGKMTREAIAARGSRMVLARVMGRLMIWKHGAEPFSRSVIRYTLAESYSLSYLQRVAKGNQ